jgi:4-aminobutyrate aminotransferase
MFAFEHYNIEPDIVCLGKGLGAGIIPMAAIVARESYNIATDISLGHFTFEKSPLGSVAALAMLEFIEEHRILDKVNDDGEFMRARLGELQEKFPIIGDVRGLGLLWGVELVKDRVTREKAIHEAERTMYECLNNGLSFKVSQGNVLQLSPPLIITRSELTKSLQILEGALTNATVHQ